MKLLVLGATGGTGLEIVRQALIRGHWVTALVRSPNRLQPFQDRISIKKGDLLSSNDLERAGNGQDAILSAFGPRIPIARADANLLQRFAVALTNAMRSSGVKRVVVESVSFLFKNSIMPPTYLLGRLFFPELVADTSAMERTFKESGLDWTMVRPPQLTDKPFTGRYRVGEGRLPAFGFKISRADVADYMIKAVENRLAFREIVGLCN